jgi:hypothetical protein
MKHFFDPDLPEPLIVNFGGGVDSTAILVGLTRLVRDGDESARPDLVLFADTGGELPATYENVERMSKWLRFRGFPSVTTVSRPSEIKGRVGYTTLEENCLENETLPSEAFGRGACSSKWKHEPMDAFLFGRKRPYKQGWLEANGFAGLKPTKLIGYDATETKCGKRGKWAKVSEDAVAKYRFPLVEWGWTRERCIQEIAREGLPVPVKSACFFCPNQQVEELRAIAEHSPELFLRALVIEQVAHMGRHGLHSIEGLWRRTRKTDRRPGSWVTWAQREGLLEAAERAVGKTLEEAVADAKPDLASSPRAAERLRGLRVDEPSCAGI